MDAADHGEVILAAILGHRSIRALDYALTRVTPELFDDPVQATLFTLTQRYADQTRGILPREALGDLMRDKDPGTALLYATYYDRVTAARPAADAFRHSLTQLRELYDERITGEALAQGMEILRSGARDERGRVIRGHAAARAHVLAAFAEVERGNAGVAPEGDVRAEAPAIRAAYAAAREQQVHGTAAGILTGVDELDRRLGGGHRPGELVLVAGWTSAGKTAWCVNLAWNAAVMQGRNVVLFTTETLRPQVRTRLVARHSRHPKFATRNVLNTRDIKAGTLNSTNYAFFSQVLEDFHTAEGYGRCWVAQVPRGATVATVEARLAAVSRWFTPDLVIIDYLQLLRAQRTRKDRREELVELVMDAKQLAETFGDGRGIPLVSPWQVSREGWRAARETGSYNLAAMSETAEASNSPDLILTLLEPATDESRGRRVREKLDVLKNRDGERGASLDVLADFASCYFEVADRTTDESVFSGFEEE